MAEAANITETYSLTDCRTGKARVSRLVFTGLNAAASTLATWTDSGRLWIAITGSDFSVRRRGPGVYAGTDEVCSGTISGGKVTLTADNSSGIAGTADVDNGTPGTNPTEDSTLDVVVSYADENDLLRVDRNITSLLVSSVYPSGAASSRFEVLLNESKRMLDRWLLNRVQGRVRYDEWGRPLLGHLVRTGDFARCHALLAAHLAAMGRGILGQQGVDMAAAYGAAAEQEFKRLTLDFDFERDGVTNESMQAAYTRLVR